MLRLSNKEWGQLVLVHRIQRVYKFIARWSALFFGVLAVWDLFTAEWRTACAELVLTAVLCILSTWNFPLAEIEVPEE